MINLLTLWLLPEELKVRIDFYKAPKNYSLLNMMDHLTGKLSEISARQLCILQVDTPTIPSISSGLRMEMEMKWNSTGHKRMLSSGHTEYIQNIATVSENIERLFSFIQSSFTLSKISLGSCHFHLPQAQVCSHLHQFCRCWQYYNQCYTTHH